MFLRIKVIAFLIIGLVSVIDANELPEGFTKCKISDPKFQECVKDAVNGALPYLKNGIKSFGILPIEPLAVNTITINQGENSPISLKQSYKNINIVHLSTSVVKRYHVDLQKFIFRCDAYTPVMEFIGDYTMDGRILLLPIRGHGKSNVTMIDLRTIHEMKGEPYQKNNETYMRFTKYSIKFRPKSAKLMFENLFNGDKLLGDTMNKFLNDNWEIVFQELIPGYEETFGILFKDIANKLFTKVPLNKIFLN